MAGTTYSKIDAFGGVNRAISERDNREFSYNQKNLDSNVIDGQLVSRDGQSVATTAAAGTVDKFINYYDEEWGKDVLLVFNKDSVTANRNLYLFTKTPGGGGQYAPYTSGTGSPNGTYKYGNLELGDRLTFLLYRNGVRIGTGTGTNNKALYAGYIDRSIASGKAMFNDQIEFNDFFVTKQQWVQQANLFGGHRKVIWDSTRERYYVLTFQGVEIRDSDWYIKRVLDDVRSFLPGTGSVFICGGIVLDGDNLYVAGQVPGATSYKIVKYDINNNYEIQSTTVTKSTPIYSIDTDGTNIFSVWTDNTDSWVGKYNMNLGVVNDKVYPGVGTGETAWVDITILGSNLYIMNHDTQIILETDKNGSTSVSFSPSVTGTFTSITSDGTRLYYIIVESNDSKIYETTPASPFSSSTKTLKATLTGITADGITLNGSVPLVTTRTEGQIRQFDGTTNFNLDKYIPGKFSLSTMNPGTGTSDGDTFWYAASLIDIFGQESHLMSAVKVPLQTDDRRIRIWINADAESYDGELSSPSTDPAQANSIWNEFRRIKKVRLYRAYSSSETAQPTTNYRFLAEIDINDNNWVEETNNTRYYYEHLDDVDESDISSVTYEESSQLPETFKPYYTNWQYGIEHLGRFYYGNLRTDELNTQQIIRSPLNSPDIAYQHDQNIEYFYPDDGDQIQGFASVWNRIVVFKGFRCAIYNELNRENIYDVGLTAPDSVIVHNNRAYFLFQKSIYELLPSGYQKISLPIDIYLGSETGLANMSALYNPEKQKLWFHVRNSDTYCYNLNKGTWDIYDLNTGAIDYVFVANGINNYLLAADSNTNKINYVDRSDQTTDVGSNFSVYYVSPHLVLGEEFLDFRVMRMLFTFQSTDNITVTVRYINKNGAKSKTLTFDSSTTLKTQRQFISGMFGQEVYIEINQAVSGRFVLDSFGFYHTINRTQRINVG